MFETLEQQQQALLRGKELVKRMQVWGCAGNWRAETDVWRTWYERGSAQWRKWVDGRQRKENGCTVPNVDGPRG